MERSQMKESGVKMHEPERSCWGRGQGPEPPARKATPLLCDRPKKGAEGRAAAARLGVS